MKDRIEIDGVSYVKEEPKKEIPTKYYIRVIAGEVFLYGTKGDFSWAMPGFESKTITKEEADYASNKPTEGDWEFRVPKKGETILGYRGGGQHIKVKSWEEKGPLSGRRWVKKEEKEVTKEEKEITFEELYTHFLKYYVRTHLLGQDADISELFARVENQISAKANAKD